MKIGYARVSTEDQDLAPQIEALCCAGCEQVFSDHGVSGVVAEREGLEEAIAALRPGYTLVVWKLDRLGRSLKFVMALIEALNVRGCGFASLTEGFDTTTNTGKLVFHIVGAICEFERGLISERTVAGLHEARRQGRKLGRRYRLSHEVIVEAHRRVTVDMQPIAHVARDLDVCHDTLRRGFRRNGLAA